MVSTFFLIRYFPMFPFICLISSLNIILYQKPVYIVYQGRLYTKVVTPAVTQNQLLQFLWQFKLSNILVYYFREIFLAV